MDLSELKHLPVTDYAPAELSEDARLLLAAAALMERDGFAKGCLEYDGGQLCLLGSILKAACGSTKGWNDTHPLHSRIVALGMKVHPRIARWNDLPTTTAAEVIGRIRATALELG